MSASEIGFWATLGVLGTGSIGIALQGVFQKPEKEAKILRIYEEMLSDSVKSRLKLQKKNGCLQRQHQQDDRKLADRDELLKLLLNEMTWSDPAAAEKWAAAVQKIIDTP